jgi:hypothetical protein
MSTIRVDFAAAPKNAIEAMTTIELAWLAGFYEGEGWVSVGGGSVRLGIAQKDPWPLEQVAERVGLGTIRQGKTGMYFWTVCGQPAVALLEAMRQWLSPRRIAQGEDAIAKRKSDKVGRAYRARVKKRISERNRAYHELHRSRINKRHRARRLQKAKEGGLNGSKTAAGARRLAATR